MGVLQVYIRQFRRYKLDSNLVEKIDILMEDTMEKQSLQYWGLVHRGLTFHKSLNDNGHEVRL